MFDPAGGSNHHLWIIIHFERNYPAFAQHSYVLVSASSSGPDRCCVLSPGDHSFFAHDSVIRYDYLMLCDGLTIERHLLANPTMAKPPISVAVLQRILGGLHASEHTREKYLHIVPKPGP